MIANAVTRNQASALLGLAGFRVVVGSAVHDRADASRVDLTDLMVVADRICSAPSGTPVAQWYGAGRPSAGRVILLAHGASGYSRPWCARQKIDAVVPVQGLRSSVGPPEWTARLATLLIEGGPHSSARLEAPAALRAVAAGAGGFDALTRGFSSEDPVHRQACLRYLAAAFPLDQVLPWLERVVATGSRPGDAALHRTAVEVASAVGAIGFDILARVAEAADVPIDVRRLALERLARHAPPPSSSSVVAGLLNEPELRPDAAEAALSIAIDRGADGLDALVTLADADTNDPDLRKNAVRAVQRRFPGSVGAAVLSRWAASEDPLLCEAAFDGAEGAVRAAADLATAEDATQSQTARLAAISRAAPIAPHDPLRNALARLIGDPSPAIRARAVEWWVRRPDIDPAEALAATERDPRLARSALLAALMAGRAGFEPLLALATRSPATVRAEAIAALGLRFEAERVLPAIRSALMDEGGAVGLAAVRAAALLGRPGHAAMRGAVAGASDLAVRWAALDHLARFAGPSMVTAAIRRALVDEQPDLQQLAVGLAIQVAGDADLEALCARLAKSRRTDLAEIAVTVLIEAGAGGYAGLYVIAQHAEWPLNLRRRASAALRTHHGVTDDLGPQTAAPTPPSPPWSGPTEPASAGRRAATDPQAVRLPPRRARTPRRMVSLGDARDALQAALDQGQGGFRALRTLADHERVPDEVRVQAMRHLAAEFPDRDVRPVLENALASDRAAIREAALGGLMVRSDARRAPIARLVGDPTTPPGLRMRAGRFLASRWPKRDVMADLESMLDDDHSGVQRVALEGLFPSMQYTPPDRVEARLINLLEVHSDVGVRAAAARALGVFGGLAARAALERADSWLTDTNLKSAIQAALKRLRRSSNEPPHRS